MVKSPGCLVCGQLQRLKFVYQSFSYYKCPNCGLVSTLPYPTPNQIIKHYQSQFKQGNYFLSRTYASQYSKIYTGLAHALASYCQSQNLPVKNAKLLDIGTFTGDFLDAAAKLGFDVYGTDLQKEAVALARKKFPGKIYLANVTNTRLPHKHFDIITILGAIEHMVKPAQLIAKATALLRHGGVLMLQTPDSGSIMANIMGQYWPPYAPIEHLNLFSRQSLEILLQKNGYTRLTCHKHFKWLPISYVYQNFKIFGPEFHHYLKPFAPVLTQIHLTLPFYGGEIIMLAKKV